MKRLLQKKNIQCYIDTCGFKKNIVPIFPYSIQNRELCAVFGILMVPTEKSIIDWLGNEGDGENCYAYYYLYFACLGGKRK